VTRNFLLAICLLASACGRGDEDVSSIQFDQEVTLVTKISSSGGALGNETYRLFYHHKEEERLFFEGVNPGEFSLKKLGPNKIQVTFCNGSVSLAQPIFLGPPRWELIQLDLKLACENPS
jgi:hypothetical protein